MRLPRQSRERRREGSIPFISRVKTKSLRCERTAGQWYPEVAHFCEGVPIILIATKTDLRLDRRSIDLLKAQGRAPISPSEGLAAAKRMGAKYAEVSAMQGDGVYEVFEMALREAMKSKVGFKKLKRPTKCTIL
jgi:GTPase SAR1 family protein